MPQLQINVQYRVYTKPVLQVWAPGQCEDHVPQDRGREEQGEALRVRRLHGQVSEYSPPIDRDRFHDIEYRLLIGSEIT